MPEILWGVGGLAAGLVAYWMYGFLLRRDAQTQSAAILEDTRRKSEATVRDAEIKSREVQLNAQTEIENKRNQSRDEARKETQALERKKLQLDQLTDDLKKQEMMVQTNQNKLKNRLEAATEREKDLNDILSKQREQLHKITGLGKDEATKRLLQLLENDLADQVGARLLEHEQMVKAQAEEKSREILLVTMQRYSASLTSESTTSTVDIPNDDMKGRIIGREGRNIRAFEKETGVDLIIDDTPGVVIISGFDPVRREIGRQSLEKLIDDGRIHPSRIEELVRKTKEELESFMRKTGAEAAQEADIVGLHPRIIELLGRLHFRTSYSQNVLRHSMEVAYLSGMIAEMVGLDGTLARRCGLLHDLGKAADHEMEGGHPAIGADILKRHGEGKDVVHAALGHHDQILIEYPYTVIVATADAASASRPGARRESLERYVKRMEELEVIAKEFPGVEQAFAIQAGREVRVLVSAKDTNDERAAKIARDIATAFEERLSYPGEIRVTVIRESRFMELAK